MLILVGSNLSYSIGLRGVPAGFGNLPVGGLTNWAVCGNQGAGRGNQKPGFLREVSGGGIETGFLAEETRFLGFLGSRRGDRNRVSSVL
jgi:hypothetical protein